MSVDWDSQIPLETISKAVMRGVVSFAGRVQTEGTRLIQSPPKSGRIYRRRGVEHQASAPGEAPASDSGRLANSSEITLSESTLSAMIVWHTLYAAYLQFGTEKMEPRPWADKALANVMDLGLEDIRTELKAVLR